MSSQVILEKRRPGTVISESRVRRRDASEKKRVAVAIALGESVHQEPADWLRGQLPVILLQRWRDLWEGSSVEMGQSDGTTFEEQ